MHFVCCTPSLFKHQVLVQAEWPNAVGCSPTSVCVLSLRCQAEPTFQYLKTLEIKAGDANMAALLAPTSGLLLRSGRAVQHC